MRTTDPRRFGRVLTGQAFNAASTYANPEEAVKQSSALTVAIGKKVGDSMGESTQTFITAMQSRLTETFNDIPAAIKDSGK